MESTLYNTIYLVVAEEDSDADQNHELSEDGASDKVDPSHYTDNTVTIYKRRQEVSAKMGPVCTCKNKCYEAVDEKTRINIYKKYHGKDMTPKLQKQFIVSSVFQAPVARHTGGSCRRQISLRYSLPVDGKSIKVCKIFFLKTLGISEWMVRAATFKARKGISLDDRRTTKKISENMKESARRHIRLMLENEPYPKPDTQVTPNLQKVYSAYLEYCTQERIPKYNVVKKWLYRHILKTEYKLSHKSLANKVSSCLTINN